MVLSRLQFALLLICIVIPKYLPGKSKLPVLATKQSASNLRFISHDGRYTYYQRRSGDLLLSTNYKVSKVIEGKLGTNYEVSATKARKKIVITQNQDFHVFYSIRGLKTIYVIDYGKIAPQKIDTGVSPTLHLDDSWISYYYPPSRELRFRNIEDKKKHFNITIINKINPYFTPQVIMPNDDTVFYTDLNEKGIPGIIMFDRKTKKIDPIYVAQVPNEKLEICLNNEFLIMGRFGMEKGVGSSIYLIERKNLHFKNLLKIYQSENNDPGNMVCDVSSSLLYFSKKIKQNKKDQYEIASLDYKSKSLKLISDLGYAIQPIGMDGKLLTQKMGQYYVLVGTSDMTSDQLPETK